MCTSSNSLAVESTFAIMISLLSSYLAPNSSQIGVSCLQCPHHGASEKRNIQKHNLFFCHVLICVSIVYFSQYYSNNLRLSAIDIFTDPTQKPAGICGGLIIVTNLKLYIATTTHKVGKNYLINMMTDQSLSVLFCIKFS